MTTSYYYSITKWYVCVCGCSVKGKQSNFDFKIVISGLSVVMVGIYDKNEVLVPHTTHPGLKESFCGAGCISVPSAIKSGHYEVGIAV